MANIKFSPDLFLEVAELNRFKKTIDEDGFRKNILDNTVRFGLIKNFRNQVFSNAKVERDFDTALGRKTIKIREIKAIDSNGQFIYSPEINGLSIQSDGEWYWVKVSHQYSTEEQGTISIAANGDLTGIGTFFTQVLRGMPNFPARIKFTNSNFNTLEYDVLEVIDDTHAIVVHPANTGSGIATYDIESGLKYSVVGTFTSGVSIPEVNKYPFQYDSARIEIVKELSTNMRPSYIEGQEFYIARVKVDGSTVIIQDKRLEYWETKASSETKEIDTKPNPLIGLEYIKWQNNLSPAYENEVYVAWGMRSKNWAIDSSKNIVTLFGSSIGGRFKTVNDFTDGDFNGWRVYTENGVYSKVVSSVKQGQAINLTVDVLDVDNYSIDGGITFNNTGTNNQWVLVVPDCEEVELQFKPDSSDLQQNVDKVFSFPVNTLISRSDIEVYKDPECLYNVSYRYKSFKEYTEWNIIDSDLVGYYRESSFDNLGNLKVTEDRVLYPYISDSTIGFIKLTLSPNSYSRFISKVFKGDLIGVKTVSTFNTIQVYELVVGRDKRYQYITGNITLDDDVYISLSDTNAIEGNEFRIHLDGNINLNGYKIYIVRNYTTGNPVVIKTITDGDIYEMKNTDGGIVFDCIFSDTGFWNIMYQNYNLEQPFSVEMFNGDVNLYFDESGLGKVKGWYGFALMNGQNGTDDISDRFILGSNATIPPGTKGGSNSVSLDVTNIPPHRHRTYGKVENRNTNGGGYAVIQVYTSGDGGDINRDAWTTTGQTGGIGSTTETSVSTNNIQANPFNIKPAYYAMAFVQKLY